MPQSVEGDVKNAADSSSPFVAGEFMRTMFRKAIDDLAIQLRHAVSRAPFAFGRPPKK